MVKAGYCLKPVRFTLTITIPSQLKRFFLHLQKKTTNQMNLQCIKVKLPIFKFKFHNISISNVWSKS
jgi:hypothetical protein